MNTKLQNKRKHKGGKRKREKKGSNAEEERKGTRKKQESSIVIGNQCKKDIYIYIAAPLRLNRVSKKLFDIIPFIFVEFQLFTFKVRQIP